MPRLLLLGLRASMEADDVDAVPGSDDAGLDRGDVISLDEFKEEVVVAEPKITMDQDAQAGDDMFGEGPPSCDSGFQSTSPNEGRPCKKDIPSRPLDGLHVSPEHMQQVFCSKFGIFPMFSALFYLVDYETIVKPYVEDTRVISNRHVDELKQPALYIVAHFRNSLRVAVWLLSLLRALGLAVVIVLTCELLYFITILQIFAWCDPKFAVYISVTIQSFFAGIGCLSTYYWASHSSISDTYIYCPALLTTVLNDVPRSGTRIIGDLDKIASRVASLPIPDRWHIGVTRFTVDIASYLVEHPDFQHVGWL